MTDRAWVRPANIQPISLAALWAAAMLMGMFSTFPAWAEWIGFAILIGLTVWPLGRWAYRRFWDRPRTFALAYEGDGVVSVGAGDSIATIRISSSRPIELAIAKLVLSDEKDGKTRPKRRSDVRIVELSEGGSPDHIEGSTVFSFSRVELRFHDAPLLIEPEEPQYWQVRFFSEKPWSGFLVFIGYDEDRYRRYAFVECRISGALQPSYGSP